jgi:hypothetical protein
MMNPMQSQMGMGGTPQMSEEELKKLAMLLQNMPAGEGIATVTPTEEDYMKDVFQSGKPLPGTEGLGPGGGMAKSFQSIADEEKARGRSYSSGGGSSSGGGDPYAGDRTGGAYGHRTETANAYSGGGIEAQDHQSSGSSGGAPSTAGNRPGGGENRQQERELREMMERGEQIKRQREADAAAEEARRLAASGIEKEVLTSDTTFERWHARNKDKHGNLSREQMEKAYNIAATKSREDATSQVPKMVESMNNFFDQKNEDGSNKYNENTTFDEFKASLGADVPPNLSEATLRDMFENARKGFQRGEAFTLTPEEVEVFARDPIVTDEVTDAAAAEIGEFDLATETEVGEVADVTPTEVEAIASVTDEDLDAIFAGGADKAEELLLKRISGEATSPAEQQLKRTSEQNMRMLLGMTAGVADPTKMRQMKNQWADMQQIATGQAADLRSKESMEAEKRLIDLYEGKDTKTLNTKLANMEKDKQVAFKKGDMEAMRKITNQQTLLTKVVTKANLDQNTELANLEAMKTKMIEQGKMDMATNLANMQKNVVLAETDAKLAVQSRAMDDGLAMANFQGQKELYGLEAELDMDQAKNDLTLMGFDLQRDLAELDSATQKEIAQLTASWRRAQGDDQKQAAIIGAVGTIIGGIASSDIRAKTNISPGVGQVEAFLDALNEYKYEYKDPQGDQAGMFVGVMAQDLEKTPMGASFVKDTPAGKQVDYGHGLAAILASQANIHDRLRQLEEG